MIKDTLFGGAFKKELLNNPHEVEGRFYTWDESTESSKKVDSKIYSIVDVQSVLTQGNGIHSINLVEKKIRESDEADGRGNPRIREVHILMGVNGRGKNMFNDTDLVAAPCPPYCGAG